MSDGASGYLWGCCFVLYVLGQIEGVDLHLYRDTVLPRVLEQIVNCKDEIARYYFMDCVIQVFPDEYHLQTLDILLAAFPQLQVVEAQVDMPAFGAVTLYSSLLTFALHVYPERLDYADQVLGSCVKSLSAMGKVDDSSAFKQIVALLSAPLDKYNDVMTALNLSNYPCVMEYLDSTTRKVMATVIIKNIMKNNTHVSTSEKIRSNLSSMEKTLLQCRIVTPNNHFSAFGQVLSNQLGGSAQQDRRRATQERTPRGPLLLTIPLLSY